MMRQNKSDYIIPYVVLPYTKRRHNRGLPHSTFMMLLRVILLYLYDVVEGYLTLPL